MRRAVTMIMAVVMLLTMALTFAFTSSGEGTAEFLTAVVANGAASLPAEAEGVDEIGILYIPADATDITGVFTEGKTISSLILKGNAYDAASIQAVKDAAPITVYYNRLTAGGGTGEALADASGVTLINLLGSRSEIINSEESNKATIVGTIAADDIDYDDLYVTAVFKKPGMADKTLRQQIRNVYTTVRGAATTYASTAASQGLMYIEDAKYLFGLTVNGIPTGCYDVKVTVDAVVNGQAVTSGETNSFSVVIPDHEHELTESVVAPQGEARGYTQKVCSICGYTEKYGPYDYSLYSGVDFENNGKFLIPYNFDNRVYTIEATVNVPTDYSGRPGVIVGNYGAGAGFNFEIFTGGKPRLYFAIANGNTTTSYNYYFNYDVRSNDPVNLALTFKRGEATLYADGEFVETLALGDFAIPQIGRTLVMGGDCRSGNSAAFKGTIYSVSIFRDYRAPEEIREDLILADSSDANCCVSYNLLDASVLGGGVELSELEYAQAHDAEELAYYASVGVKEIEVMNDIVLDRTVYVVADVTIYANGDYTIRRDPGFAGDMFVIGENSVGRNLILEGFTCQLTFGKEGANGSLTVDGNKENTTVDVYGTLVYVNNSGVFNMTDQITLTNNKKVGNSRTLSLEAWYGNAIGGAAIININGIVNMNGGVISNCESNFTDPSNGDNTAENYLECCYGGAVFNDSNFVMNGGSFVGNTGFYGGAIADFLNVRINAGVFDGNYTSHAGGAIYVYNNEMKELVIGSEDGDVDDVVFRGNYTTMSSGGAIYSGMKASLLIYGGVTFDGNHTYGSGGAVYIAGVGVIKGSTSFTGNYAGGSGGAIYITQDTTYYRRTVRVSGAAFENNSAGTGGAIGFLGSESYIEDCTFTENTSRSHGGAVYVNRVATPFTITGKSINDVEMPNGQGADVTVSNCTFTNNASGNEAGGLFGDAYCTISVDGCTFTGNTSVVNGGAVSVHGTTMTLTDNIFTNNTAGVPAAEGEDPGTGAGGALYISYRTINGDEPVYVNSVVTLSGGSFTGNSTAGSGSSGAVQALAHEQDTAVLTANGVTFTGNTSGGHAGAVNLGNGTHVVNNCTFTENTAAGSGGAVYMTGALVTGSGNTFTDNVSNNTNYGGGAIYVTGSSNSVLTTSVFTGNEAKNGGGVAVFTGSSLTLTDVTATGNSSRSNGGFAFAQGENVSLTINKSINGESVIGSISDSSLGNTAEGGGGAIYMNNGAVLTLEGVTIAGNTASGSGGALYVNNGASANVTGTTISGNAANYGGAAIIYGCSASFTDCTIENNTANVWGGAFYIRRSEDGTTPGVVTAEDTTFDGNTVSRVSDTAGGAIYLNADCSFTAEGCSFENNVSEYTDPENVPSDGANGGAIFMSGRTTLTLTDTDFAGNSATTMGGALYVSSNCTVDITGGSMSGNTAGEGGAIFSDRLTTVTAQGTTFSGNNADGNGGAISSHGTTYVLTDCDFENNTTGTGSGAAFYASYRTITDGQAPTTATITGGSFTGNDAHNNGGAIYATVSTVDVDGTTFSGNHGSFGGCIAVYSGSTVTAKNVTATANTATRGAFGYIAGSASTLTVGADAGQRSVIGSLTDSTLGNSTTGGGGVIFADGGSVSVSNSDIGYNSTNGSGGFAYAKAPFTVENCTIKNSTAGYGGAMIVYGVTATITDVTFDSCVSNSGMGGAIYLRQGEDSDPTTGVLDLTNVNFLNGVSTGGSGGAIYGNTNTAISATGCTFTGNTSTNSGAIYTVGATTLTNCTFTGNTAGTNGGAVSCNNTLTITGCTFTGNTATASGGAVYISKSDVTLTLTDSTFVNNSATDGGAIFVKSPLLTAEDLTFTSNSAAGSGGAAYLYGLPAGSAIRGLTAQGNTNTSMGGWAYMNRSTLTIEPSDTMGVLFGTDDEALADGLGNSANSGGAFYCTIGVDLTVNDAYFGYNKARYGGAITGSNASGCAIEVNDTTFVGNNATTSGGAIHAEGAAAITANDSTFNANTAPSGGAVNVKDSASYTDNGCVYSGNTATSGGAYYLCSTGAVVSSSSTFTGNTATNGGAVYTNGQNITMDITFNDVTMTDNGADSGSGGAVYAYYINFTNVSTPNGTPLKIHGITAQGNHASSGGFVYLNRATVSIDAGTNGALIGTDNAAQAAALGNYATSSGGLAYHTVAGYLVLNGVTVGYNRASTNGGAAYVYHADGSGVTANDSTFVGNSSKTGGAFYAANIAVLTFTDCDFTDNSAQTGGAIYAKDAAVLSFDGCSFTGNRATTSTGGAMESYVTTAVTFTDCSFENNYAKGNGGAIRNSNATAMTLTNVTFRNNSTEANGDCIFTTHGSGVSTSLTIDGMTIDQPTGSKPIFISQTNTNVTITRNSVVDVNHSPTDFSLIVYGSSASVINSSVTYV